MAKIYLQINLKSNEIIELLLREHSPIDWNEDTKTINNGFAALIVRELREMYPAVLSITVEYTETSEDDPLCFVSGLVSDGDRPYTEYEVEDAIYFIINDGAWSLPELMSLGKQ